MYIKEEIRYHMQKSISLNKGPHNKTNKQVTLNKMSDIIPQCGGIEHTNTPYNTVYGEWALQRCWILYSFFCSDININNKLTLP